MMAYKIMLVMIIFGAVNGALNTSGMYLKKLPEQNAQITQAQVTEMTKSVGNAPLNPWTMYTVIAMVFGVIGSALLALLTVIPILTAYGCPMWLALCIQTPLWLVVAWGIYEIYTGHVTIPQD